MSARALARESARARRRGHRSPLVRTLFLVLWMGGISLVLFVPLFVSLTVGRNIGLTTALLLAAAALLPTFGASRYASIEKNGAKEYLLSAVIAVFGFGTVAVLLMAACSLLFEVENLAQVIMLVSGWIPAISAATVLPLLRAARAKRAARRGYQTVCLPVTGRREITVSILGGLLFGIWFHVCNLLLLMLAKAGDESVIAGVIFPLVWGLFAVHRPHPPRRKAYVVSAILAGALPAVLTFVLAFVLVRFQTDQRVIGSFSYEYLLHNPLIYPALLLSPATLSMTVLFPLLSKPAPEPPAAKHID